MGKLPQSLRRARFPITALTKLPATNQDLPSKPTNIIPKKIPPTTNHNPLPPTNLSEAKTLLNSLSTRGPLDTHMIKSFCNSLLSFSTVSTLQDSIFLLTHMLKTLPTFSPTHSTFHIILSQFLSSSTPSSHSSLSQILSLMTSHGFPPTPASTDIAVRTLCGLDRVDEAVEVVKFLSLHHAPPDTYSYNFLVKHLIKNRSLSNLHSFIDEMRSGFGLKPDIVTYTIMIDNVCNQKNLREAMRLLEGHCMLSQGVIFWGFIREWRREV